MVFVLDVDAIDDANQSFTANVYIKLRWKDALRAEPGAFSAYPSTASEALFIPGPAPVPRRLGLRIDVRVMGGNWNGDRQAE